MYSQLRSVKHPLLPQSLFRQTDLSMLKVELDSNQPEAILFTGPSQSGKSTIAQAVVSKHPYAIYFSIRTHSLDIKLLEKGFKDAIGLPTSFPFFFGLVEYLPKISFPSVEASFATALRFLERAMTLVRNPEQVTTKSF